MPKRRISRAAAIDQINMKYELLTPVTSVEQALKEDAPRLHPGGNILSETTLKRGDPHRAIQDAAYLAKGIYMTQRVEHAYLETECALAKPCLERWGSRNPSLFPGTGRL